MKLIYLKSALKYNFLLCLLLSKFRFLEFWLLLSRVAHYLQLVITNCLIGPFLDFFFNPIKRVKTVSGKSNHLLLIYLGKKNKPYILRKKSNTPYIHKHMLFNYNPTSMTPLALNYNPTVVLVNIDKK